MNGRSFSRSADAVARPGRRRGVSLLEVLISIGIVAVGLLGVMALLPLGYYQAAQGTMADVRAAVGNSAFREFRIRGMGRVVIRPDGSVFGADWIGQAGPVQINGVESYCIDPRFVSRFGFKPFGLIRRITLRSTPPEAGGQPAPMSKLQADEVFTSWDDLVMQPTGSSLPPVQMLTPDGARREADGHYSWMATLVPQPGSADLYTLSVVVIYRRVLDVPDPTMLAENEKPLAVKLIGGGIGGGDVELSGPGAADVKRNRWLMLSQPIGQNVFIHNWYRVAALDDQVQEGTRVATLAGADLNPALPTQGTFVKGAVAVYAKTVRLSDTTIWDP